MRACLGNLVAFAQGSRTNVVTPGPP